MANSVIFHLRPLPGDEVLRRLALMAKESFGDTSVKILIQSNLPPDVNVQNVRAQSLAEEASILAAMEEFHDRPYLICKRINIVSEGQPQRSLNYQLPKDHGVVADLTLTYPGAGDEGLKFADLAAEHFDLTSRDILVTEAMPESLREATRARELAVEVLQAQVARLATLGAEQHQKNNDFLDKKVAGLDERYETKERSLEEAHRAKEKALEERKKAFVAKEAEFETRDSRHVRRDLLKTIRELIEKQKEIKLSSATSRKRWVSHVAYVVPIIGGFVLAGLFSQKLLASPQVDWHYLPPITGGLILFASMLVFYLKWINAWSKEHADLEFRNMRFSSDILRASWLAELVFEWQVEKDIEIPDHLIASFSRNLFMDERSADAEHPAEALGKLFRNVAQIGVGQEGLQVKMKGGKVK